LKVANLKPPSPDEGRACRRNSRKVVSSAFDHTAGAFLVVPPAADVTSIVPRERRECEEPLLDLSDIVVMIAYLLFY
jgi:hypothetical protein